jgi:hypothetical protein
MYIERDPITDPDAPVVYQIRVKGHLGHEWGDWFGDLVITLEDGGETLLTGLVLHCTGCSRKYAIWVCHWSPSAKFGPTNWVDHRYMELIFVIQKRREK